jgi:hypothetical protein
VKTRVIDGHRVLTDADTSKKMAGVGHRCRAGGAYRSLGAWTALPRSEPRSAWEPRPRQPLASLGHLRARLLLASAPRVRTHDHAEAERRFLASQVRREHRARLAGYSRPRRCRFFGRRDLGVRGPRWHSDPQATRKARQPNLRRSHWRRRELATRALVSRLRPSQVDGSPPSVWASTAPRASSRSADTSTVAK